jgi:hypothetical protein
MALAFITNFLFKYQTVSGNFTESAQGKKTGTAKKKPPGCPAVFEICCVSGGYAKVSRPPKALENQK